MRKSWHLIKKSCEKFHENDLIILLIEDKIGVNSGKATYTVVSLLLHVIAIKIIMRT